MASSVRSHSHEHWTLERRDARRARDVHPPASQPDVDGRDGRARTTRQRRSRTDDVGPRPRAHRRRRRLLRRPRRPRRPRRAWAAAKPVEGDPGSWGRTFASLESMPQPVVAAVDGQAWGGGCELSLACTLRVASERAHFGQPEVAVGIIPGGGGTQRLPRLVGAGRAAELDALGAHHRRRGSAAHRPRRGGAARPTDFVEHVLAWVQPIATKPPAAVRAAKRAMIDGLAPAARRRIAPRRPAVHRVPDPARNGGAARARRRHRAQHAR